MRARFFSINFNVLTCSHIGRMMYGLFCAIAMMAAVGHAADGAADTALADQTYAGGGAEGEIGILAASSETTITNGDGSITFVQRVDAKSTSPHYVKPSRGGYGIYSWFDEDYGWKHTFPYSALPGLVIQSATLTITAWDVDAEPYHGYGGEYDGVTGDGSWLNPQYLQGSNNMWSVTIFNVDGSTLLDGQLSVFLNIDMHHSSDCWATTLSNSILKVTYRYTNNRAPYSPTLSIAPTGSIYNADTLNVYVTGPAPADPDNDAVSHEYRWLVDVGTGNYIDDEFAGRNNHTNSILPGSDTQDGDRWMVEVTPIDEHGLRGTKSSVAFATIGSNNSLPIADPGSDRTVQYWMPTLLDGSASYDPDGTIASYKWEAYTSAGSWMTIGTSQRFNYTFHYLGTYTLRLTVTDNRGSSSLPKLFYVTTINDVLRFQTGALPRTVAEGSGALAVNVVRETRTVTTTPPSGAPVPVVITNAFRTMVTASYVVNGNSATEGADFTAEPTTNRLLVFAPGETAKQIPLAILDDAVYEGTETLALQLSPAGGGAQLGSPNAGTISISDNESMPTANIGPVVSSVPENVGMVTVVVSITTPCALPVLVPYLVGGTATVGDDHSLYGGTAILAPGATNAAIPLGVVDDAMAEDDETIVIAMGTPSNAVAGTVRTNVITIVDDDATAVRLDAMSAKVPENRSLDLPILLGRASTRTVAVRCVTSNESATAGADYGAVDTMVTFLPGTTSQVVNIPVHDDGASEPDETFIVCLVAVSNAALASPTTLRCTILSPVVDILTPSASVTYDIDTISLAGTNNAHVVGGMWMSNSTTGVRLPFPASLAWTTPDMPLAVGANVLVVGGTNAFGAMASAAISIVRGAIGTGRPLIDITNESMFVTYDTTNIVVGGTNNAHVVGAMHACNDQTGEQVDFGASPFWMQGFNLTVGVNRITVSGTNALGVPASDSITILRGDVGTGYPFVHITNDPPDVTYDAASVAIAGTNNLHIVGGMAVSNLTSGISTTFTAASEWSCVATLVTGRNTLVVRGTNALGQVAEDSCDVVRGGPGTGVPHLAITSQPAVVTFDVASYTIGGTANVNVVGDMAWSNELTGANGVLPSSTGWTVPGIPLAPGSNAIVVVGRNLAGTEVSDRIVIVRGGPGTGSPVVDITNVTGTVVFDVTSAGIGGSANTNVVGGLAWSNELTGASGSVPAASWWECVADNLAIGSNVVRIVGTNVYGASASDIVVIVRGGYGTGRPFLDLTNDPFSVVFSTASVPVAGTNNLHVVGGMTISNATNGATAPFAAGSPWLSAAIAVDGGANTLVVSGTNAFGVRVEDRVVVTRTIQADAGGPYVVNQGSQVLFDGTASSGIGLEYRWETDAGFVAEFSTSNGTCAYVPYVADTNVVTLRIRDQGVPPQADSDQTTLVVRNVAPSVNAGGPYAGYKDRPISFAGVTAVDPGIHDVLELRWDFGDGSGWTPWMSLGTVVPHVYSTFGIFSAVCEVRDNCGGSGSSNAVVTVFASNVVPVAVATLGTSNLVATNLLTMRAVVTLDGSGSYDDILPATALRYDWREDVANPAKGLLSAATKGLMVSSVSNFPLPGIYLFHLVVNDGELNSEPDTVTIVVPGIAGRVVCDSVQARIPLFGVTVTATNPATGIEHRAVTDERGGFAVDSGNTVAMLQLHQLGRTQMVLVATGPGQEVIFSPLYGNVSVLVTNPLGAPVPLVQGTIVNGDVVGFNQMGDFAGALSFGGVPDIWPRADIHHWLTCQKMGWESATRHFQPDFVSGTFVNIVLAPSDTCTVQGTVVGLHGMSVAGVAVDLGPCYNAVTSAANGAFTVTNVMRGTYYVRLEKEGFQTTYQQAVVPAGSPVVVLDRALTINGGTFSAFGTVAAQGNSSIPVTNAMARIVTGGAGRKGGSEVISEQECSQAGYFDAECAEGERTILFEAPGYIPQEVTLNVTNHTPINIELRPVPEPAAAAGSLFVICYSLFVRRARKC